MTWHLHCLEHLDVPPKAHSKAPPMHRLASPAIAGAAALLLPAAAAMHDVAAMHVVATLEIVVTRMAVNAFANRWHAGSRLRSDLLTAKTYVATAHPCGSRNAWLQLPTPLQQFPVTLAALASATPYTERYAVAVADCFELVAAAKEPLALQLATAVAALP